MEQQQQQQQQPEQQPEPQPEQQPEEQYEQQDEEPPSSVSQHAENGSSDELQGEPTPGGSATVQPRPCLHLVLRDQPLLHSSQYPDYSTETSQNLYGPQGEFNTASYSSPYGRHSFFGGSNQNSELYGTEHESTQGWTTQRSYFNQRPGAATLGLSYDRPLQRPYYPAISRPYSSPYPAHTPSASASNLLPSPEPFEHSLLDSIQAEVERRRRQQRRLIREHTHPLSISNPVDNHQGLGENGPMPFHNGLYMPSQGTSNSAGPSNRIETAVNSGALSSFMAFVNDTERPTVANETSREAETGPGHNVPPDSQGEGSTSAPQPGNSADYTSFRPFETYDGNREEQAIARLEGILALDDARRQRRQRRHRREPEPSSDESDSQAPSPRATLPAKKPVNSELPDAGPSVERRDVGSSIFGPFNTEPSNAGPSNAEPSNVGPSNAGPSNAGFSGPDVDLEAQTRPAQGPPPNIPQVDGASGSRPAQPAQPAQPIPLAPLAPVPNAQPVNPAPVPGPAPVPVPVPASAPAQAQAQAQGPPPPSSDLVKSDCGCFECPEGCNPKCCIDWFNWLTCGCFHYGYRVFIVFFLIMLGITGAYIMSIRKPFDPEHDMPH
ncbi:uncharacterized protein F4807DRAFT_463395 [Annulohypoxylon truncatum]|uniref:uncharacterized protein n=1 Tax=Annulohypoxylon truncatum TaxID=327061 RepID=UPI002007E277|nr:uncharacterized protein F4807DRAFT_463395 [Annulohypoxylon truncatum]KAI1206707.1 hypothetical protein F4807DRAFT_463395 [Annulohypoxylon truncatum]